MADTNSAFDDFVLQAQEAASKPVAPRETYKTAFDRIIDERPDVSPAEAVRGVLRELGFESSGADAMDDDELIRVVKAGRTVLRLYRKWQNEKKEAADV